MNCTVKIMETEAEIRGKAYVHWKSWQETYAGLIDQEHLDRMTLDKCLEIARRWPENTLVALDGDQVVGFACFGPYRYQSLPNVGELCAIYVLQSYQGKKVGLQLMLEALNKLKDYPTIALWVLKGNEKAVSFYKKFGFQFDGVTLEARVGAELRMVCIREKEKKS